METRVSIRRPDGTIEIVTKPGTILDQALRRKITVATRNAGRGEVIGWEIVGQMPTGPSYKEVLYGRRDGSDRICRGCGRPGDDGACGLGRY